MKFTIAIVALLSVTSAIKIRGDDAAAAAAKVDEKAAAEAGKPDAAPADPANPGKAVVAEALKTEE